MQQSPLHTCPFEITADVKSVCKDECRRLDIEVLFRITSNAAIRLARNWWSMHHKGMSKYLISFPSEAMVLTDEELPVVSAEAHAVIEQAKAAGVYVFGGGIAERIDPVLVSADGLISAEIYPGSHLRAC